MKKIILFFLVLLFGAFIFTSCEKEDPIETPPVTVESFLVSQGMNQHLDTIKVSVVVKNIDTGIPVSVRMSGGSFLTDIDMTRTNGDTFTGKTIVYDTDIPSGTYQVKLYIDREATTYQSNITITWGGNSNVLSTDITVTPGTTTATAVMNYSNAIANSFVRVRLLNGTTVVDVHDYELVTTSGLINLSYTGLVPGTNYSIIVTGVPTANDYPDLNVVKSFTTATVPPGTLAANLSTVFNTTPNSGYTTITYVNTTSALVTATLNFVGTVSGLHTYNVSLPMTNFASFNQLLSGLTPGEMVTVSLISTGTLATTSFVVPLVTYTNVTHTQSNSSSTTVNLSANQTNYSFSKTNFTANGVTHLSSVTYYWKSNTTGVAPWDVLLLLGQTGNNVAVGSSSAWTNMGDGWYAVTIPVTTAVAIGGNQSMNYLSTKSYSIVGGASFSYKALYKDAQNVVFGNDAIMTANFN